jgi:hypothetical protein
LVESKGEKFSVSLIKDPDELFSPSQHLVPKYKPLPDDIPFAQARELFVNIPVNDKGRSDGYIDDLIGITADLLKAGAGDCESENVKRLRAILLSIHIMARPGDPNEPIPREVMEALNKLAAEAGPEELKIILGWLFDTRRLLISLPDTDNKAIAWIREIDDMLLLGVASAKRIEKNIGRYVNVAQILPMVHHFLNRLRCLQRRATKRRSAIKINDECIEVLKFLKHVIELANKGISMNSLAYCLPERVYRSDSCPHGLGGMSDEGFAWRWMIPEHLRFRAPNNVLEHIATVITVWLDTLAGRLKKGMCKLSMSDSTTSVGWLKKSNFDTDPGENEDGTPIDPVEAQIRMELCRKHALLCLDNEIQDFSQWFRGKDNNVTDSLSRDHHLTDEQLTYLLRLKFPEQVPEHFEIVPLPSEIVSWLTSLLLRLPVKKQLQERHTTTRIELSEDGTSILNQLGSKKILTSIPSPDTNETSLLVRSPWLYVRGDLWDQLMVPWLQEQSQIPFHIWHRPSGRQDDPTHPSTMIDDLASFYRGNTAPSGTRTPRQAPKSPPMHHPKRDGKTSSNTKTNSISTTRRHGILLRNEIMRIFKSPSTRTTQNRHPQTWGYSILQRWGRDWT